jgi:hypothetical protein
MATTEFLIESTFEAGGRGYVVACLVDPAARFEVAPGATLGGCSVERWLDMPRAVGPDRKQRTDLFGFCLSTTADLGNLKVGDRVVLV